MVTNAPQDTASLSGPRSAGQPARAGPEVDWRAIGLADHACCCLARPAVVAILPSAPGRPHPTELLLCGHHYRVSRRSLTAAGAKILDPAGTPIPARHIWVGR